MGSNILAEVLAGIHARGIDMVRRFHDKVRDRRVSVWQRLESRPECITFRRRGTVWSGHTRDRTIMMPLFVWGGFQTEEIDALVRWMKRHGRITEARDTILDVGAHIGTTSIPLARQTGCRILAVEPLAENFELLQRNVRQNGLQDRIVCVQKAVLGRRGAVSIAVPAGNNGGAFVRSMQENGAPAANREIRVIGKADGEPLMNILDDHQVSPDQIALTWCDVEGCEPQVIGTGEALWTRGVPIFLEINPDALRIQNSLQSFQAVVARYFDRYVESGDLIRGGAAPVVRPVAELPALLEKVEGTERGLTDILLLPKAFEGS
jgi:FkbM family methyltransferase